MFTVVVRNDYICKQLFQGGEFIVWTLPKISVPWFNHLMNEMEQSKKGWGCLQWGVVISVIMMLASLIVPALNITADMATQTSSANNCRQIIMALKIWASENDGVFPDAGTPQPTASNQVFRKLIQSEIIQDERIFGSNGSPFRPDNIIGNPPDYARVLEPGENH
jgi:hypothetical protein